MKKIIFLIALLIMAVSVSAKTYKIAWSHYTGWEPWGYISESGIMKKWADKYGVEVEITLINDYIESINQYTAGQFDACVMTNMDALSIPAVGGIDSEVLIIGDFSNGNDGIVAKNAKDVKDLKGREIKLVEYSVSHYLLVRALEMNGMKEKDIKLVNTSDADIGSIFITDKNKKAAAVTWNPILMQTRNAKDASLIFDSSNIPGEIIDILLVNSKTPEEVKKAMAGAWYEMMDIMSGKQAGTKEAIEMMATQAGSTEAEFKAQLKTTEMFYTPKSAVEFANSPKIKETMEYVRTFLFDHGLFGEYAKSKDFIGIEFADKTVIGDKNNVKLRFTDKYMKEFMK